MRRLLTALLLVAATAGLVACGQSDQEQARELVQDYVEARTAEDHERVCGLFSDGFKEQLAVEDCPAFVQEQSGGADGEEELEVVDVRVNDDRGRAELDIIRSTEGGPVRISLLLIREDGDWRIESFQ